MCGPWLLIVHDMWCQWWVLLFSLWQQLVRSYLFNERTNRIEQVLLSWQYLQNFSECNVDRCAVLFFKYVQSSAVSVGIRIPNSASTPQVGFMWRKASPTREETSKFQGHRRRYMEVPRSGVLLGSLARFEMAVGLGRSTLGSENRKELFFFFLNRFP